MTSDTESRRPYPTLSEQQVELFRAMEDIHEMTSARTVILVDGDGKSVAVSGDEAEIPPPVRAVLGGKRLAEAGSVVALLSPIGAEIADSRLNVSIYAVDGGFVLAIVFDAEADLLTVQSVGAEARIMLAELLREPS